DWNFQEELNRYMDCPRNHPGALADVGYEHNRYDAIISQAQGDSASFKLTNAEPGSPLYGLEKRIDLVQDAAHISVTYTTPENLGRVSTEVCLSPDYHKLLKYGKKGLALFNGPSWRGWSNGPARAWVRINPQESTIWDKPYQSECGHGLTLRLTSFSREFHLELGLGTPPRQQVELRSRRQDQIWNYKSPAHTLRQPAVTLLKVDRQSPNAGATNKGANGNYKSYEQPTRSKEHTDQILSVTNPHFMRRFLSNNLPAMRLQAFEVAACRVRMLKPHHDKLTIEYNLQCRNGKKGQHFVYDLVGTWRQDNRNYDMDSLYKRLWEAGFCKAQNLNVPQPAGYWNKLHLRLREKALGKLLKDWINYADADWTGPMRRVGAWLAKLHNSTIELERTFNVENELRLFQGWLSDLMASDAAWMAHEKKRVSELMEELICRTRDTKLDQACMTHGDFHPENIFVRGNSITVIDFEQSVIGEPASDLGYLLGEIDVQSDRYWHRRGRHSPVDIERTAEPMLEEYVNKCGEHALEKIAFYCARTYMKHLIHTVRMKGNEDPHSVTLWLDKAEACLADYRPTFFRRSKGTAYFTAAS
ncbi:MAG TPA: phosphotransferase, partial [Pyrinomonadaceae bacterium]